jgi:hypothetical protein
MEEVELDLAGVFAVTGYLAFPKAIVLVAHHLRLHRKKAMVAHRTQTVRKQKRKLGQKQRRKQELKQELRRRALPPPVTLQLHLAILQLLPVILQLLPAIPVQLPLLQLRVILLQLPPLLAIPHVSQPRQEVCVLSLFQCSRHQAGAQLLHRPLQYVFKPSFLIKRILIFPPGKMHNNE